MFLKNPITIFVIVLVLFFIVLAIAVKSRFDMAGDMKKDKEEDS